jgi:uncharacterized protein (TIGR03067 family)
MTARFRSIVVALTVISALPAITVRAAQTPTKPTGIMAELQGTWTMTSTNGEDVTASGQQVVTIITNNRYEQTVNGQLSERGTFKIDESKKPMTVDVTITEGENAGRSQVGVFQVSGKTLTVKLAVVGSAVRPTDFTPADGFITLIMVKK